MSDGETTGTVLRVLPNRIVLFRDATGQTNRARAQSGPVPRPGATVRVTNTGTQNVVIGWSGG